MVKDSGRTERRRHRHPVLCAIGGLAVLASVVACGASATSAGPPDPTPATVTAATAVPSVPLAAELVGRWETQTWLDSSGSRAIVRTYRFARDGRYDYTIALCRSSTDCTIQATESGQAQSGQGTLALRPRTRSADGPRAFPYVVIRDPDVGDVQLHLTLRSGQLDVFYAG